jgi:hypothetical protein
LNLEDRPKVRARRLGVVLEAGPLADYRPIISLWANGSDGGITLSTATPAQSSWHLTATSERRGFFSRLFARRQRLIDEAFIEAAPAPKLHYHRSGFTSVQAPNGKRVGIQLKPMDELRGEQIFSVVQRNPARIPAKFPRQEDSFVVVHDNEWPPAVTIMGFVFNRSQIPYSDDEFLQQKTRGIVRGKIAELTVDLSAHGLDAVLVIRIDDGIDGRTPDALAATTITGFNARPGELPPISVQAATTDGGPSRIFVAPDIYPEFPEVESRRTTDRREELRPIEGGRPVYGDFI